MKISSRKGFLKMVMKCSSVVPPGTIQQFFRQLDTVLLASLPFLSVLQNKTFDKWIYKSSFPIFQKKIIIILLIYRGLREDLLMKWTISSSFSLVVAFSSHAFETF